MCTYIVVSVSSTVTTEEKMPQTNKSVSGGGVPGQAPAPDQGEPPPPAAQVDAKAQVAAGDGAGELHSEDKADTEVIKSPSDPKKYRWDGHKTSVKCDFSASECPAGQDVSTRDKWRSLDTTEC